MRRIALIGLAAAAAATTATIAGLVAASGEPAQGDPAPTATLGPPPGLIPQINFPQFPSPPPNITPMPDPPRTPTPIPVGSTRPAGVPTGADLPRTPSVPTDARPLTLAEIGNGLTIGRVLVLPPGSVPQYGLARPSENDDYRVYRGAGDGFLSEAKGAGLSVGLGTPPDGYALLSGGVEAASPKDGGPARILREQYGFISATQHTFLLDIRTLPDDGYHEVVAYAPGTFTQLALKWVEGVPTVIAHASPGSPLQPALRADFVLGSRAIRMEVSALPIAQFEAYVEQFIREHKALFEAGQ